MPKIVGLLIDAPGNDSQMPVSAREITAVFKRSADSVIEEIGANWDDEMLDIED